MNKEHARSFLPVSISDAEYSAIRKEIIINEFDKHSQLLQVGTVEKYFYIVTGGVLRTYMPRSDNKIVNMQIAVTRMVTNSLTSFLSGNPSVFAIEALRNSCVIAISKETIEKNIQLAGIKKLYDSLLMQVFRQYEVLQKIRVENRLNVERLKAFNEEFQDVLDDCYARQVSSLIGVTEESFCRVKNQFYKSL